MNVKQDSQRNMNKRRDAQLVWLFSFSLYFLKMKISQKLFKYVDIPVQKQRRKEPKKMSFRNIQTIKNEASSSDRVNERRQRKENAISSEHK